MEPANGTKFRRLLPVFLLLTISFAVNFNALSNEFVYDDTDQVLQNSWIKDARNIPVIFTNNAWGFSGNKLGNYYRPMMHISYMVNYFLFGMNPIGFHLTSILFHAVVTLLVYFLSLRLVGGETGTYSHLPSQAPLVAAAVFAVHPIHTEAVAWVACIPELSFTLFYLASLILYIRSSQTNGKVYYLSLIFFFISCLCKETALTLLLVLVFYEHIYRTGRERIAVHFRRYAPYFLVSVMYLFVRYIALGGVAPFERHKELSSYENIINVLPLFAEYCQKLLLPINLNAFHVLKPIHSLLDAWGIAGLLVATCFAGAVFIAYKKNRTIFLGLLLIVLPLLPVLYIPGVGENVFTERYLYLPSVGFSIIIGTAFDGLFKRHAYMTTAILVLVLSSYSAGTISRNMVWRNGYNLWTDTVAKSPEASLPRMNLGLEYFTMGRLDEAEQQFRAVLAIAPGHLSAHNGLGLIYDRRGLTEKAIQEYITAINLKPDVYSAHDNLGTAYLEKGWNDMAITEFLAAIKINPANAHAYNNLGVAYFNKGWTDKAIEEYSKALELNPEYSDAHNNLGVAYFNMGWIDNAMKEHLAALQYNPQNAEAHYRIGLVYKNKGLVDQAMAEYRLAIKIKPSTMMYNNLGNCYAAKGQFRDAINQYEMALKLDADNKLAKHNIEQAQKLIGAGN